MRKKNVKVPLYAAGVLMAAFSAAAVLTGCGVKQISDTVIVEAGQELELKATDFFHIREERAEDIVFDISKVDILKTGNYEVKASYQKKNYTINVTVEDTTAPEVVLKERYVITNDAATLNPDQVIEGVYDASGYSAAFIRYERTGNLTVLDDTALKELTDKIPIPGDAKALADLGDTEIPKEEGIYRTVLAITDESGNTKLEEMCLILDKTGARIADAPDKVIEAALEDLDKEPEVDPSEYHIFDNVDGVISPEDIIWELERMDEKEHTYLVHVSYVDRAGNESRAKFLIVVKEQPEKEKKEGDGETNSEKSGKKEEDRGTNSEKAGNEREANSKKEKNGESADKEDAENTDIPEDKGTFAFSDEKTESGLTIAQKAVIDAGYGVVTQTDTGYAVMVHGGEDGQILEDFLASIGCRATHFGGSWINYDCDQYMWVASGIVPLITADDPEFWD